MEKFAIDLDRVLDEFEFNEDRAEQVASNLNTEKPCSENLFAKQNVAELSKFVQSSRKDGDPSSCKDPSAPSSRSSEYSELEETPYGVDSSKPDETIDIRKSTSKQGNADSVNDFYNRDRIAEKKVPRKRCVDFRDGEPVSLTIRNDISQKLAQKKQNEGEKNHNSYDKKLNQPNIKPSVSNVFSSLNEYINAPSGNLEQSEKFVAKHGYFKTDDGETEKSESSEDPSWLGIVSTERLTHDDWLGVVSIDGPTSDKLRNNSRDSELCSLSKYQNVPAEETESERIPGNLECDEIHEATGSNVEQILPSGKENNSLGATELVEKSNEARIKEEHSYENVDIPHVEQKKQIPNVESSENLQAGGSRTCTSIDVDEKLERESYKDISKKSESLERPDLERSSVDKSDSERSSYFEDTNFEKSDFEKSYFSNSNPERSDLEKLNFEELGECEKANSGPATVQRVVGFGSTMDDLSDDQLSQYLAELEAESEKIDVEAGPESESEKSSERARTYENVEPSWELPRREESPVALRRVPPEDEDENEAPIFETVTIGDLPTLSEVTLQEKAKKFPVIDYSSTVAVGPDDFLRTTEIEELRETKTETGTTRSETIAKKSENRARTEKEPVSVVETTSNVESVSSGSEDVSTGEDSPRKMKDKSEPEVDRIPEEFPSSSATIGPEVSKEEAENFEEPITPSALDKSQKFPDGSSTDSNEENAFSDKSPGNVQDSESHANPSESKPQTLDLPSNDELLEIDGDDCQQLGEQSHDVSDTCSIESNTVLGKQPPFWIPDHEAPNCMLCDVKFTVIKRRHHCRACGKVLCNKCCSMKYKLEYQGKIDSRVCSPCYQLLTKAEQENESCSSTCGNSSPSNVSSQQGRQPNPSNPMEYCSTIPPLQQLAEGLPPPPTVMVPVGVLKREGSTKQRPEGQKSVMFSDGIRPGCDLTELDTSWDLKPSYRKIGVRTLSPSQNATTTRRQNVPPVDPNTNCYIPHDPELLPPTVTIHKGEIMYHETVSPTMLYKSLKNESEPPIMFAINRNLYAYVKITNLNCCVNRICWNVTSRGLACVGQDEVILLVETLPDETQIPKDLLIHINQIYTEAIKGNTITDLGVSIHQGPHFLGSREHAGFLFIRQTFQCLQKIVIPPAPFLVGLLVHRWETPWAKVFPLRLMLRLGAEYRYYPCPLVSVRFREAVYFEIGHTIMKVLADFRNFAYTLPGVRGMTIHMQDRTTDVLLPKNRYDQVIKGLNNSNDHVLAFAANFSIQADSHLVCIQTNNGDESSYQTQAININNKPRKITGASFIVINGALKSSMGLSAKSSIVEDGLMVQIMPEKMEALKAALKNMQDFSIGCGLQGAPEPDETVNIKWVENDVQFNLGVKSPIDGKSMDGVPSIRVHNGTDYMGTSRFIRWTEVFILKSDDHPAGLYDPVDINKLSESIAKATCAAFVKLLDLLATGGLTKIAVRATIHPDNVGYEAGSEGTRLPPIYMNSLDNELIQVLHKAAQMSQDTYTVLELIFHVLDD